MSVAVGIRDMSHAYGDREVLRDVDLDVRAGELVCVVGPTGSGKTTLLRCLAGLLEPTEGHVEVAGRALDGPSEEVALVFQDYTRSLLPWMSVAANVELVLASAPPEERRERAREALRSVGLDGFGERHPWELSGGMQQRVAIARALAYRPRILLMDEPFAAVDAQTRGQLEDLTLAIRASSGVTVVFVTHDVDEAVYLADRVVVLGGAPTTVAHVVDVELGTERDLVETRSRPEFAALRAHVLELIRGAVRDGRAATTEGMLHGRAR